MAHDNNNDDHDHDDDPYGYAEVVAAAARLQPHILTALETRDLNVGRVVFPSVPERPAAVVALNFPPTNMVHVIPPTITGRFRGGSRNPTVEALAAALESVDVDVSSVIILDRWHLTLPSDASGSTDVTTLLRALEQSAPQELQAFQDAQSRMRERILISHFRPTPGRRLPVLVASRDASAYHSGWFASYAERTGTTLSLFQTVHPSTVYHPTRTESRRQSDEQLTAFGRALGFGGEPSHFFENQVSFLCLFFFLLLVPKMFCSGWEVWLWK